MQIEIFSFLEVWCIKRKRDSVKKKDPKLNYLSRGKLYQYTWGSKRKRFSPTYHI